MRHSRRLPGAPCQNSCRRRTFRRRQHSTALNTTLRVAIGPGLAALVIVTAGVGAAFLLNTVSFIGVIVRGCVLEASDSQADHPTRNRNGRHHSGNPLRSLLTGHPHFADLLGWRWMSTSWPPNQCKSRGRRLFMTVFQRPRTPLYIATRFPTPGPSPAALVPSCLRASEESIPDAYQKQPTKS